MSVDVTTATEAGTAGLGHGITDEIRDEIAGAATGKLDRLGVCTADPFPDVADELRRRVATGLSGGLSFTFADPTKAADVRRTHPWARRLVVGARAYLPEGGDPGEWEAGTGRVARFAALDGYEALRRGLDDVAEILRSRRWRAEILSDDNRLVDRAAAVRAGLGWWGKSSMVITNDLGPWALLGSVVTDAPLPVSAPDGRTCGSCSACLPACPTGAIVSPGVVDARRCLAAVLQSRGDIPPDLRSAVGDRLYGCDDCLEACPPGRRLLRRAVGTEGRIDLVELLSLSDDEILTTYGRFYIPGRRASYLRRNALVALGNTGSAADVSVLAGFLGHSEPVLRRHAAWALGSIGGGEAVTRLEAALAAEADETVIREIGAALASATSQVGETAVGTPRGK